MKHLRRRVREYSHMINHRFRNADKGLVYCESSAGAGRITHCPTCIDLLHIIYTYFKAGIVGSGLHLKMHFPDLSGAICILFIISYTHPGNDAGRILLFPEGHILRIIIKERRSKTDISRIGMDPGLIKTDLEGHPKQRMNVHIVAQNNVEFGPC